MNDHSQSPNVPFSNVEVPSVFRMEACGTVILKRKKQQQKKPRQPSQETDSRRDSLLKTSSGIRSCPSVSLQHVPTPSSSQSQWPLRGRSCFDRHGSVSCGTGWLLLCHSGFCSHRILPHRNEIPVLMGVL